MDVYGALAAGIVMVGALAAVRIDGWDGSMRPIFAWRWEPTPEQRFKERPLRPAAPTTERSSAESAELAELTDQDYPGFLGVHRRGVVAKVKLSKDWNAHPPRELWRNSVGLGWSAFAVVGNAAVTQEQRGQDEAIVCYELLTGAERWVHANNARFSEALGGDGPRATPTLNEGRVYAVGATGIFNCLDLATGQRLWSRDILKDAEAENRDWGMAGSPLVADNVVIVTPGGDKGRSVWAYDRITGEPVWHTGDDVASYASPLLTTLAGQRQVLVQTATALLAIEPTAGRLLWRHEWRPDQVIKCTQPCVPSDFGSAAAEDQVLLSMGYTVGSQLVQVRNTNNKWEVEETWSTRQLRAKFSNMIVIGDFVYGLDEGILTCIDLRDGSRQWKEGRYGHGQLILVDNLLLIQAEKGGIALVEVSPTGPTELARLAALSDKTWNHPALAGRYLLVRNDREAACYELPIE